MALVLPGIGAAGTGQRFDPPVLQAAPTPPLDNEWFFAALTDSIGKSRFVTGDIDGDGRPELVAGSRASGWFGSNDYLVALEYQGAELGYVATEVSEWVPEGIVTIASFDGDGDGTWEVYVGLVTGGVRVFDGLSLDYLGDISTSVSTVYRVLLADADNDLVPEIVVVGAESTQLLDPLTFGVENTILYGSLDAAVGDVDADGANEIVYVDGRVVQVVGFETAVLEWTRGGGFGDLVELSNTDADPALEIVAAGSAVLGFDFGASPPAWVIDVDDRVDALRLADVTGDGVADVLYGDDQWGQVHCHDGATRVTLWSIDNPEHGVTDVAVADLDLDGRLEVAWGAGHTSSGRDIVFIHDVATQDLEWQSRNLEGPFYAVEVGDPDDDGDLEILFASDESDEGAADGILQIYDATYHQLEWISGPDTFGDTWHGVKDVAAADVDDDGSTEIVVATSSGHSGVLHVVNGVDHELEASYTNALWPPFRSLAVADVDNDGSTEIVAAGDSTFWVFDGATGTPEWLTSSLVADGQTVTQVAAGDVDSDFNTEIVAVGGRLTVYDGLTGFQWSTEADTCRGLDLADIAGDGRLEILVGTTDGALVGYAYGAGGSPAEFFRHQVSDRPIDGLRAHIDLSGDVIIAYTSEGRFAGFNLNDAQTVWQSEQLGEVTGARNGLESWWIPGSGGFAYLVGSSYSVHQFGGVVDPPKPTLVSAAPSVAEDAGGVSIVVRREGSSAGVLEVDWETGDGTAEAGADYTAGAGMLHWDSGDATPRIVEVAVTDDADLEGDETFTFTLANVSGGVLGSPSTATVTIVDDDVSVLRLSSGFASVAEDAGSLWLTVTRSGGSDFPVSVGYATSDGSATAPDDYLAAAATLSWSAGDTSPKQIEVGIIDDDASDGDLDFTVSLVEAGAAAEIGEPSSTVVTIEDDDIALLAFGAASFVVNERSGAAVISVLRTGTSQGEVTVDYATSDGTARAGSDYTSASGTLSWADGDATVKTLSIPVLDDTDVEPIETVNIALADPTGPAAVGTPGAAVLSITDDDGTSLRFAADTFEAAEDGGSVEITVERVGNGVGAVSVDFATGGGSATAGLDYSGASGTLSWADGELADKSFTVSLFDDGLVEGIETVGLSLSGVAGNAGLGDPDQATLRILDDEAVEFRVNTTTNLGQTRPQTAMNAAGAAVVVWDSWRQDGEEFGVYGQRFIAGGDPVGSEFRINVATAGTQQDGAAAMAADGGFVVVWEAAAGTGTGIFRRRYGADGMPLGGELTVNSSASGTQVDPQVAFDGAGNFLVVWQGREASGNGVFARAFASDGAALGYEFVVNTTSAGSQGAPAVGGLPGGGFVVVWESYGQDGDADAVIGRRFSSNGAPLGAEAVLNSSTAGNQSLPAVAAAGGGTYLVVWEDDAGLDGSGKSVRGRWFDASGAAAGEDFQINTYGTGTQGHPAVAAEPNGRAVVVWESDGQDGSGLGIFGRALFADGSFAGDEQPLNTHSELDQSVPHVACSPSGTFIAVWSSMQQDGSAEGIYATFRPLPPTPWIFADGFESGASTAWSAASP